MDVVRKTRSKIGTSMPEGSPLLPSGFRLPRIAAAHPRLISQLPSLSPAEEPFHFRHMKSITNQHLLTKKARTKSSQSGRKEIHVCAKDSPESTSEIDSSIGFTFQLELTRLGVAMI
ncbi:MAG: hypothetical protein CBE00_14320 [Planctomycetaceae bacterium TMED240]|nr:hypothetical protein [Rhodopirellula sp.]OUX03592.1 MAG: hypothetical protein CBE00_14320 [Planctomycetaceae bacterium TMED240]